MVLWKAPWEGRTKVPSGSIYTGRFRHGEDRSGQIWEKMTAEACAQKEAAEAKQLLKLIQSLKHLPLHRESVFFGWTLLCAGGTI